MHKVSTKHVCKTLWECDRANWTAVLAHQGRKVILILTLDCEQKIPTKKECMLIIGGKYVFICAIN